MDSRPSVARQEVDPPQSVRHPVPRKTRLRICRGAAHYFPSRFPARRRCDLDDIALGLGSNNSLRFMRFISEPLQPALTVYFPPRRSQCSPTPSAASGLLNCAFRVLATISPICSHRISNPRWSPVLGLLQPRAELVCCFLARFRVCGFIRILRERWRLERIFSDGGTSGLGSRCNHRGCCRNASAGL